MAILERKLSMDCRAIYAKSEDSKRTKCTIIRAINQRVNLIHYIPL